MHLPAVWCPTGRTPWLFLVLLLTDIGLSGSCSRARWAFGAALSEHVHLHGCWVCTGCGAARPRGGFSQPWVNPARLFPRVAVPLGLSLQHGGARGPCCVSAAGAPRGLAGVVLRTEGLRPLRCALTGGTPSLVNRPARLFLLAFLWAVGLSLRCAARSVRRRGRPLGHAYGKCSAHPARAT